MHEEEKFSNLSLKDKTIITSIIALFLIIVFAFIFFVYVGIFQITGIEYSSRTALLLFFINHFLRQYYIFHLQFLQSAAISTDTKHAKLISITLFSFIEITLDWFVIHTADNWIESVQMSNTAELCVVLFFFLLNKLLSDEKE